MMLKILFATGIQQKSRDACQLMSENNISGELNSRNHFCSVWCDCKQKYLLGLLLKAKTTNIREKRDGKEEVCSDTQRVKRKQNSRYTDKFLLHAQLYFGCCDLDSLNPLVCVQYPVSVIKKEKQSMLHYFYATFSKQCRNTLTKHFRQDSMRLSKIEHKLERTRLNQIEFNHIKKIL